MREALRQLDEQGAADWESYHGRAGGQRGGGGPQAVRAENQRRQQPKGKDRQANTTDPDSRMFRARNRFVQGYNAQAAVCEDQIVVAAEVINAANDTTCSSPWSRPPKQNLAAAGRLKPSGSYVADAGYWSTDNAILPIDAEILITPIPATNGITKQSDPRRAKRRAVLVRLERGKITIRQAADQMGVSETWVRELLRRNRHDGPDPAGVRSEMEDRLASETAPPTTPNARSPSSPSSGTSKRTSDSDDSPAEALPR